MTPLKSPPASAFVKPLAAAAIVVAALAVPWGDGTTPRAQVDGGPTGWCTDYEGNNFPCSDGGGGGGGGGGGEYDGYGYGGGCASADTYSEAAVNAQNAQSYMTSGDQLFDQGDYMDAAGHYDAAVWIDPGNIAAHHNLAAALSFVGNDALDRGEYMSALLYHERSYEHWPEHESIQNNLAEAQASAPEKSCFTCGEALTSDVAYGLGATASIYTYVHQAAANYENCTRHLDCNDTDGSSFHYMARTSCYQVFASDENGFRACLRQALEDRGWTFY